MTQPPFSGAPLPVQGVTGGPGINQGTASINSGNGNLTLTPPGNAVEIKKAPSALNVYEYFNSNVDNVRLTMSTATGGPEFIGVQAAPTNVIRDLNIGTTGNINFLSPILTSFPVTVDNLAGTGGYIVIPHTGGTVGTPATFGDVRFCYNQFLVWHNGANTGNNILGYDNGDRLCLSAITTGAPGPTTGAITVLINGVQHLIPYT